MKALTALLSGTIMGSALLTEGVLGAEWQRDAGITLGVYHSDNICLSNDEEKSRGAGTITPDLQLRGQGARASLLLDAAVEYNTLGESDLNCDNRQSAGLTNRESVIPSLRYRGDVEVVEDWLTLESDAFAGRNPIDPFAARGTDGFDGRDNINITYHYGAGAIVQRRLSDSAEMRLRYRRNEQHNEVTLLGDSSENRAEFDLGTERGGNRFSMGVAGRYSKVMNEGRGTNPAFNNTLSSAEARTALQLNSSWQVNALAGEEWNEFTSARSDIDGTYWDVGLRWTPNERVLVALGTGERFFGSTPRMSIRYRHRRSELTASYARSLTFPRNLRVVSADLDDPFDAGVDPDFGDLPGDPLPVTGESTFIGNTPIINERLVVSYRFSHRRTTITVAAADSRQERTEDAGEATFSDVWTTFSRSLTATFSVNARISWRESEGQGGNVGIFGQHSETWHGSIGVNRRLGSDTTMSMNFQRTHRESDVVFNQYDENRLTLTARHRF